MGKLDVDPFILGRVLNHVERGETKVYNRATYDPGKRQALAKWGQKLQQIISGEAPAKVVSISS